MSKLVFTSHCICFYYIIGVVSFAWSRYIGCWLWTSHCSSYLFPALFANQVLICFMSAAHVSPVLSSLHLRCVGSTCTLGLSWGIISVQWLLIWTSHRFNTFFFTWLRCIYIILDQGCHILYVFGLNSTVSATWYVCICLVIRSLITLWYILTCIIVSYCVAFQKILATFSVY